MKLWWFRFPWRHLCEYPGRTLLGILGIALGTAVYLSISLAGASALKSFQDGVQAVSGTAQWRLQSPGAPLPEGLFLSVRRHPEVKAAAPLVESLLELDAPQGGSVLLLGLDPFAEAPFRGFQLRASGQPGTAVLEAFLTRPRGVLVSEPLAARLGLKAGDRLPVIAGSRRAALEVVGVFAFPRGVYPLEGAVVLMDLAHAQERLEREIGRAHV